MNTPKLVSSDPMLLPFLAVIERRMQAAQRKYLEFTQNETKKLSDAAVNHLYFGLHKEADRWTIREWAPNAEYLYFIGDCTQWKPHSTYKFQNIGGGRWELSLPLHALKHGDLYKLLVCWHGGSGERLPTHCRRVVQDEQTKIFSAQVWQPKEPYVWKNDAHLSIKHPIIYEAHVGMSTEEYAVGSYKSFTANVLPRVSKLGYNVLQLMAIAEHPYYGSFGYQVSNYFSPSYRYGSPEELMALIDAAHGMGLAVVMDVVHSHSVKNENEGLSNFDGTDYQFFHTGARGKHPVWDSRCFDYSKNEVLAFLLSNLNYWLSEYRFDGFRFDGVTSMLYSNHGLGVDYTDYSMYYDGTQDEDALIYLNLANRLVHEVNPCGITIAEDVSGMPGLAAPAAHGGVGFDYRMNMGVADFWIKTLKNQPDEAWHVGDMYYVLTNKRSEERTISYAECHDQAMVGDKTIAHWLMDKDIYSSMSTLLPATTAVERGIALHKMIRLVTLASAGSGYLTFMGNEWGHPEWIDFPREGNGWNFHYARRQWSLVDNNDLRYKHLLAWDGAMIKFCTAENIFSERPFAVVQHTDDQVLVFKRGNCIFAFNFNPQRSFADYGFEIDEGCYALRLCSDDFEFGGQQRVSNSAPYFTQKIGSKHYLRLYLPCRTAAALTRVMQ